MFTGPLGIANKLPRSAKAAALAVSLVVSALLTAVALRTPDDHWLVWISFLPLFVAVRWLRPATAALAGGLWGASLYLFSTAGPSAELLALLIVILAVYVGLAARPARCGTSILPVSSAIKLLTLAFGWTLVEAVLRLHNPSCPHDGLLTGSQGEGLHLHWLPRLLGYVAVALLVAWANASLVGILSGARLSSLPVIDRIVQRRWATCIASDLGNPVMDPPPGIPPRTSDSSCFRYRIRRGRCPPFIDK